MSHSIEAGQRSISEKIDAFKSKYPRLLLDAIRTDHISPSWRVGLGMPEASLEDAKHPQFEKLSDYIAALGAARQAALAAMQEEPDPDLRNLLFMQSANLQVEIGTYDDATGNFPYPIYRMTNWAVRIPRLIMQLSRKEVQIMPNDVADLIIAVIPDIEVIGSSITRTGWRGAEEKNKTTSALRNLCGDIKRNLRALESTPVNCDDSSIVWALESLSQSVNSRMQELESVEVHETPLPQKEQLEALLKSLGISDSLESLGGQAGREVGAITTERAELEFQCPTGETNPKTEEAARGITERVLQVFERLDFKPSPTIVFVSQEGNEMMSASPDGTAIKILNLGTPKWDAPPHFGVTFGHELIHILQRKLKPKLMEMSSFCHREGFGKMGEVLTAQLLNESAGFHGILYTDELHTRWFHAAANYHLGKMNYEEIKRSLGELKNADPDFAERAAAIVVNNPAFVLNYYIGARLMAAHILGKTAQGDTPNLATLFREMAQESGLLISPAVLHANDPQNISLVTALAPSDPLTVVASRGFRLAQARESVNGAVSGVVS